MKTAVIQFPGSNGDFDLVEAVKHAGGEPDLVWHRDNRGLKGYDAVLLPGGFSYGDYLRAGAIASLSPIMAEVIAFAQAGGPVLGICNGFQTLCEAHLLPGALVRNEALAPERAETISGDLLEEYRDEKRSKLGPIGANAWYVRQLVAMFLRHYWAPATMLVSFFVANDLLNTFRDAAGKTYLPRPAFVGSVVPAAFALAGFLGGWKTGRVRGGVWMDDNQTIGAEGHFFGFGEVHSHIDFDQGVDGMFARSESPTLDRDLPFHWKWQYLIFHMLHIHFSAPSWRMPKAIIRAVSC